MKKVSILISAFNAEFFISDAIRSILLQELPQYYSPEIIIGIDGCQKTWESIKAFRKFGVKIIKMAFNYGPYVTFNTIMNYSSGDIIARFDADDVMLPGYLKGQIELMETDHRVKMTRTWSIYTDKYFVTVSAKLADGKHTAKDGKRYSGSDGQFMMRKEVWNSLGSFKPWRCFADTDFLTRSKLAGFKIDEIKNHLYVRRVHDNSLTALKETSYNSLIRQHYKKRMEMDKYKYLNGKPLFVPAVTGYIDHVL
jgi:glycosyltransferase involved in cell wall biosynthesis